MTARQTAFVPFHPPPPRMLPPPNPPHPSARPPPGPGPPPPLPRAGPPPRPHKTADLAPGTPAVATVVVAPPPRRPRGRPRKTAQERSDGNPRRQLMDGAAKLFRSKAFAATGTRAIAAAARVPSASPFSLLPSKSALLSAVMTEGMASAGPSQQQALAVLAPQAPARECLRVLIRHHSEVLLGPRSSFIAVMLYEWRSLTPVQRRRIALVKDSYEAAWMPALSALGRQGLLQAEPGVARLFIFGALNWAVQWFAPDKGKSLDELTEQALALFIHAG